MLFDLTLGRLAWIGSRPDGFDLRVNVALDVDLVALVAVLNVKEHVLGTRVLACHGAELFTAFART